MFSTLSLLTLEPLLVRNVSEYYYKLNVIFLARIYAFPFIMIFNFDIAADITEVTGKEQAEAAPAKKGRGRKQ